MPDITFVNSQKSEELRYRSTKREVANGWFAEHGFLVLPELRGDIPQQIQVILPRELVYKEVLVEKYQNDWAKVESSFWEELDHYLPEARKLHDKVVVDVGRIGTISSSYGNEKHYYLRADRGVGDLAAMMVNNTLFAMRKEIGITWTKREALMDFVMTRPVTKKLFPDFQPVYTQLLRVQPKVRRESEEYVRSLGLVLPKQELELRGGKVWARSKYEPKMFGKKEGIILKKMIERKNALVTYDELADVVWGEGEFKSFWALAKLIERLRRDLEKQGIGGDRIQSVRGQGYTLS